MHQSHNINLNVNFNINISGLEVTEAEEPGATAVHGTDRLRPESIQHTVKYLVHTHFFV